MRVLMICPELPRDDLPSTLTMAPTARQIESVRDFGLQIDTVELSGIGKLKYLLVLPRVCRLARRADVVHAHYGYCGWLAWIALKLSRSGAPLVISFMGSDLLGEPRNTEGDLTWFSKLMVRANILLASLAQQVIVKSRQLAEVIAPTTATLIPNGIDTESFRPIDRAQARSQVRLPRQGRLVLFPGNPHNPRKNYPLASAAVEAASNQLGQAIELVRLWGVSPDRVADYMNACDVMLITSLLEGSPNVVKEAMACELPVIGVDVGDVPELLRDVSRCAVCNRDPQEIARRLAECFLSPGRSDGRQILIGRGLDLASVARRVIGVYEQALGREIHLPNARSNRAAESARAANRFSASLTS